MLQSDMDTQTSQNTIEAIPNWLSPEMSQPSLPSATSSVTMAEVTNIIFDNFFEEIIERVTNGEPLSQIVREDPRGFSVSDIRSWILRDPTRKRRFYDARAIGADAVEDELISIADATDSAEDIQRSTLRINTRKWLLGVWNRDRYGDSKKLEVTNTTAISMKDILAERDRQLEQLNIIEGECLNVT